MKNISFLSKDFQFLDMKFSIYLNWHAFVTQSKGLNDDLKRERKKTTNRTKQIRMEELCVSTNY